MSKKKFVLTDSINLYRDLLRRTTVSKDYRPREWQGEDGENAGLRLHPGPFAIGSTVWVSASGRWRPAIVVRGTGDTKRTDKIKVIHSSPSNAHRVYVKDVLPADIRLLKTL